MIKELTMEKTSLPVGWKYKKLSELCKTGAGGTPLKSHKDYYVNGNIPWLRSGEVNNRSITKSELFITEKGLNNSSAKLFPKNSVLVAMYGATAGQVGILGFECSTNQAVCGIFPNDNIIPEFIYYKFLEGKEALVKQAVGGAQPNISQIKIKNTLIPDISLAEQKQIVAILDKAFAAIDTAKANAQQNLQNAKELFESYLQNVFENKGDDWEGKKWGDLCHFVRGPFGGSLKKSMFKESGYVVYEQKHAIHNHFNQLRYFIDEKKFNEMKRFEVKPGDIIMSCSGVTLGRVAIIPDNIPKGIINQALLKLTPEKEVYVEFIKHWLRSNIFQTIIFKHSGGAAIPNVPAAKILKEIIIPIPNIKEQKRIVKEIELTLIQTKKLEDIYTKKIADLEEMKKSVLQKAFSGQLNIKN